MNMFLYIDPAKFLQEHFSWENTLWYSLGFLFLAFWLATLFEILTSKFRGNQKVLWALVVFFAPVIGIILYLIFGKNAKVNKRRFTPF